MKHAARAHSEPSTNHHADDARCDNVVPLRRAPAHCQQATRELRASLQVMLASASDAQLEQVRAALGVATI